MAVVKGGTSCDAKSPIGPKYKLEAPGAINVMRTGAGSIVIFVVSVIIVIHAMRACEHQWLSGRGGAAHSRRRNGNDAAASTGVEMNRCVESARRVCTDSVLIDAQAAIFYLLQTASLLLDETPQDGRRSSLVVLENIVPKVDDGLETFPELCGEVVFVL